MAKTTELRNPYPTRKEEAAMRDVLKYPTDSLAKRAERLSVTRGGVHFLLTRAARKGMTVVTDEGWEVTSAGRAWIRPTFATRRGA